MRLREGDLVCIKRPVPQSWGGYVPTLDNFVGHNGVIISENPSSSCYRVKFEDGDSWFFPDEVIELANEDVLEPGNLTGLFT